MAKNIVESRVNLTSVALFGFEKMKNDKK